MTSEATVAIAAEPRNTPDLLQPPPTSALLHRHASAWLAGPRRHHAGSTTLQHRACAATLAVLSSLARALPDVVARLTRLTSPVMPPPWRTRAASQGLLKRPRGPRAARPRTRPALARLGLFHGSHSAAAQADLRCVHGFVRKP